MMAQQEAAIKAVSDSRRTDIDDWITYAGTEPCGLGGPGDLVAIGVQGVVKPHRLAIVKRKGEAQGVICVYLGGIFRSLDDVSDACALFCDIRAPEGSDELLSSTIPLVELSCVARVLGTAAVNKPWRDLESWRLPKRERALARKLEAEMRPFASPIQAFDLARLQGSNSVH